MRHLTAATALLLAATTAHAQPLPTEHALLHELAALATPSARAARPC